MMMIFRLRFCLLLVFMPLATAASAQQFPAPELPLIGTPEPQTGNIGGTVMDVRDETVSGARVILKDLARGQERTQISDENGAFQFSSLKPGVPYRITINADGFVTWTSETVVLTPSQFLFLPGSELKIAGGESSVTVYSSTEQIAVEQVKIAEQQRIFGFIPNFYVTYDPNPVPLSTKLKFKLAYRAYFDPVTFLGIAFMAGIYQAGDTPDYGQGAKGYGQRVGAGVADTATDIFIGGAILPWMLHQDPRYYYQGTGTKKSRALHAMSSPFICMGDNGKLQPNYSSLMGDLASGAISNIYYPQSNRGANLVFQGFLITTGVRTVNSMLQEFLVRKITPSAKKRKN